MKKITAKVCVFLLIFTMLFQSLAPLITYAQAKLTLNDDIKLYQTSEEILIEDGIVLHEGTFIYGEESDEEEFINFQFNDTYFTVSQESVKEVDLTEEELPLFVDVEQLEPEVIQLFNKDQAFYSLYPDETIRIQLTEDMEYPVYLDELGLEIVYIGNIAYYLNEQDRNIARDAVEANDPEELPNSKEGAEDESEQNGGEEDSSGNLVDEPEKQATEESIETEEESASVEEEHKDIEEQKDASSDKSDQNKNSTVALQSGANAWKNSSAGYFKVEVDDLTVYSKGNTKKLGSLTKGQVYPVDANYGNWHQIQFGNTKGYVYKADTSPNDGSSLKNKNNNYKQSKQNFVALQNVTVYDNSSGQLIEFGKINSGERYPIVSEYGKNWSRIIFADRVGYVLNSEVRHEFTGGEKYFTVLVSNLPVYDNRTGSLKQIGSLTKGQSYEIVADYGNWHRIQYNNHYGYVQKSGTEPADGAYIRNKNTGYNHSDRSFTTLENTIVYDNTGGKLRGFGTIQKGQSYYIQSDYGNWWRIIFADRVGYVQKSKVKQTFVGDEKYFRVLTSDLPVYDNRFGRLDQVGTLTKGQEYEIASDYGKWHRIQYNNHYGYVLKTNTEPSQGKNIRNKNTKYKHGNYIFRALNDVIVYDNSSGTLKAFGRIGKDQFHHIAGDYGKWWIIIYAGRVGYVQKSQVITNIASEQRYFQTLEKNIPIYKNEGNQLVEIGELENNTEYVKVRDYGNWHEIRLGNDNAYIWKEFTEPSNGKTIKKPFFDKSTGELIRVLYDTAVYDNSGSELERFATLNKGTVLSTIRPYGNWYELNLSGRVGYIHKNNVKPVISINDFDKGLTKSQIDILLSGKRVPIVKITNARGNQAREIGDMALKDIVYISSAWDVVKFTSWDMDPFNNTSWQLYLNSLYPVSYLLNAYETTHEVKYFNKATKVMEDWIIKNPNNSSTRKINGWAWADHAVSNRLIIMTYMVELIKENNLEVDTSFMNLMLSSMKEHVEYQLSDNTYRFPHNHGVIQDRSIIQTALVFSELKESTGWINIALTRLGKQINAFVSQSGVHLEHSPFYHVYVIQLYDSIDRLLKSNNMSIPKETNEILEKMYEYLAHITRPDLLLPFVGDTNELKVNNHYGNQYLEYVVTQGKSGVRPSETDKVYEDAGVGIFRDEWKDNSQYKNMSHLVFQAGYHSDVHKQADDLSFVFNSLGENILVDTGQFTYSNNVYREYFRSTKAHNTISVDNKSYEINKADGYGSAIKQYSLGDDYSWISAEHKLFSDVKFTRTLLYLKPNVIVLFDDINSSKKHSYQQVFNLGEKFEIENLTNNLVEAKVPGKDIKLSIKQLDSVNKVRSFKDHYDLNDKINPVRGYASTNTNQLHPIHQVEFEKTGTNESFITILDLNSSGFSETVEDIEIKQLESVTQVQYKLNGEYKNITIPKSK